MASLSQRYYDVLPTRLAKLGYGLNAAILACSVLLCELLLTFSPEDRPEGTRAYLMYILELRLFGLLK
jgi:hypothetical protein